jgi:hypothetical protein
MYVEIDEKHGLIDFLTNEGKAFESYRPEDALLLAGEILKAVDEICRRTDGGSPLGEVLEEVCGACWLSDDCHPPLGKEREEIRSNCKVRKLQLKLGWEPPC